MTHYDYHRVTEVQSEQGDQVPAVQRIMDQFARLTGLTSKETPPKRYLWTDAFALCNYLELYERTEKEEFYETALLLVDQVHNVLGRHRGDDGRKGWISGLSEEEGRLHPTRGGLRIGKGLKERRPSDFPDERLEWDRDGQYFHYLTKWMHALNKLSGVTGNLTYNRWAIELAKAAHAGFVSTVPSSGGQKRMYWKMSIDLSYPLVRSMGQHDPLDGYITYKQLQATGDLDPEKPDGLDLSGEIEDMAAMCQGESWITDDALGIGGLLCDSYRSAQLIAAGAFDEPDLPRILLEASLQGLKSFVKQNHLKAPADRRLPFRELGLSIGLEAVERLGILTAERIAPFDEEKCHRTIETLATYMPLCQSIGQFWLTVTNQQSPTWTEHCEINMVMLATSLAPDGFLTI